jgi:predicted transposase/invertase (TIGR01784 family)
VPVEELRLSLVDVKCFDERGRHYVVEMQVLNCEGFEKRVVYNTSKSYVPQGTGDNYPGLADVVGVTICDFLLWPDPPIGAAPVPMLSRWRKQEQHDGAGPSQVHYVFLELPKYSLGDDPLWPVDRWAYFFCEAKNLAAMPPALSQSPYREALEVVRLAGFDEGELDLYERAKMAEQDARGALSLAFRQGFEEGLRQGREERWWREGLEEGLREAIRDVCQALEIEIDAERETVLAGLGDAELKELQARLLRDRRWG